MIFWSKSICKIDFIDNFCKKFHGIMPLIWNYIALEDATSFPQTFLRFPPRGNVPAFPIPDATGNGYNICSSKFKSAHKWRYIGGVLWYLYLRLLNLGTKMKRVIGSFNSLMHALYETHDADHLEWIRFRYVDSHSREIPQFHNVTNHGRRQGGGEDFAHRRPWKNLRENVVFSWAAQNVKGPEDRIENQFPCGIFVGEIENFCTNAQWFARRFLFSCRIIKDFQGPLKLTLRFLKGGFLTK